MGKHSAAPASRGAPDQPRDTAERDAATAGAGHPTAEFPRAGFVLPADEPIELLAEPLAEPLHEPLAAGPAVPTAIPAAVPTAAEPVEHPPAQHPLRSADVPVERPGAAEQGHRTHRAAGARRAPVEPASPGRPGRGRRIASYAAAAVLTALAWGVLVYFAIQLGPDVKDGEPRAWALMVVATIGAMACLFLSLILAGRVLDTLRPAAGPPPPPGGRRAKR